MPHRLLSKLNRPLFGTLVIPAEARVDPQHFPDADFPVHCPHCDYLLRGLPEPRCPECGQPFDRGRLLVQQYVERQGSRERRRRLATLAIVILSLVLFKPAGVMIGAALGASISTLDDYARVARWFEMALLALICGWVAIDLRRWLKRSNQRQAILSRLQPSNTPSP